MEVTTMVDAVSIIVGAASVIGLVVFAASYYAAALRGRLSAIESGDYVSTDDLAYAEQKRDGHVEQARRERVRDVESTNTAASIKDERVAPTVEQSEPKSQ